MDSGSWSVGDWLIFRKPKRSRSPGPRAQNIAPATKGENYRYTVDKYWIVVEILDDGHLMAQTLRGKQHRLPVDDSQIRKPSFWERWVLRSRYREIERSIGDRDATDHSDEVE